MQTLEYLRKDLLHALVNSPITLAGFLFYVKFGFYGWPHLATILMLHYAVHPLDDWLEGNRRFPRHVTVLVAIAFYLYPLITALVLLGTVIINVRAILKKENFLLERLESLGNFLMGVVPFALPLSFIPSGMYIAAVLFILFTDSMHKIGHRETRFIRETWVTAIASLALVAVLFFTWTVEFFAIAVVFATSLLPFAGIRDARKSWIYTQVWLGGVIFLAYYYYLFVFLP